MIDVTNWSPVAADNVIPGEPDCLPALQKLLRWLLPTRQAILYFPQGLYRLGSTLDLSAFRYLRIQGDGACAAGPGGESLGTTISGKFADDLIRYADPADASLRADIADIYLQNGGGNCLHLEGTGGSTVSRCRFDAAGIGLNSPSGFDLAISSSAFYGMGAKAFPGSIGLQLWMNNATLRNLYGVGWGEAFRLCGMSGSVAGIRAEVNAIAFRLGISPAGAKEILGRCVLQGLSLEANDIGILSASLQACRVQNTHIQGTTNAPSGQSQVAIDDRGSSNECVYEQISTSGNGFSQAAFVIEAGIAPPVPTNEWRWCTGTNAIPGKPAWQIAILARQTTVFSYCNQN